LLSDTVNTDESDYFLDSFLLPLLFFYIETGGDKLFNFLEFKVFYL